MIDDDAVRRAHQLAVDVLTEVGSVVVGKQEPLELALAAILAGGHVLIEDNPGLGKTLAARSLAQALGLSFHRLQFTPDLLPADVTGSFVWDQRNGEFAFRPGPLFAGLVLADEINRTSPKTQSALLEAMQEGQVTVEGQTFDLPRPFHVVATANPIEYEGTYPLPEAQLDRFLLRVSFGYPTAEDERLVLHNRVARRRESGRLRQVTDTDGLLAAQRAVEQIDVDAGIVRYCVDLARATRADNQVLVGASPRGALALMLTARALAVVRGRDYPVPEDVKAVARAALAHRITLRPEMWMRDVSPAQIVTGLLATVPAPSPAERGGPARPAAGPDTAAAGPSSLHGS